MQKNDLIPNLKKQVLYRKFKSKVELPSMKFTNTQFKTALYPIHYTFKGKYPIPWKPYLFLSKSGVSIKTPYIWSMKAVFSVNKFL